MLKNVDVMPPGHLDPELLAYFDRLVNNINIAVNRAQQCDVLTEVPAKPMIGKIYYFKNAIASTPIISDGYWGYTVARTWTKLG